MNTSTLSRRTVTRGAAWSIPVIVIGSPSPAIAASGSQGPDLALVETDTIALINAHRSSLGLPAFTVDSSMTSLAENLAPSLATRGTGISAADHQTPGTSGMRNENLGATFSTAPMTNEASIAADFVGSVGTTNGWLGEPHSYAEYKALLDAGKSSEASDMFYGRGTYAADGESGHRIAIEDPNNTVLGIDVSYTTTGTASDGTTTFPYEAYAVVDFK